MMLTTDKQSEIGTPISLNWSRLRRVITGGLTLAGAAIAALAPVQAHQEPAGCLLNNYSIGVLVDRVDAHIGDTLFYSVELRNLTSDIKPTCLASDLELRVITPDHKTNTVVLRRNALNPGETDFYPNVASYVIRSQDVILKGGSFLVVGTGLSTAVIHQNDVNENSENFRDVNTIIANPCIQIAATCQGGVGEGAPITYTGSVTNCGDIKLTGVVVSNSLTGLVLGPIDLQPREGKSFSGSYAANPCGASSAALTATGQDVVSSGTFTPKTVTSSTSVSCANTYTPGLVMNVNCGPTVRPTENLTFSGTVQNTGNITLKNVVVTDNVPAAGTVIFTKASLAPGETANFSGFYVAPAACSSSALFNAAGATVCDVPVSAASRTLTCPILTLPEVAITRVCSANAPQPGAPLSYTGTVVNRGRAGLRNIRVVSAVSGATPVFTLISLAPGATANFNGSFTTPAGVCSVSDTLTVLADDECGNSSATNSVTGTCPVATAPSIVVTHDCPTTAPVGGASGSATGSVRNSGNITLNNVTVVNGTTVVFGPATLTPNQASPFTFNFTAPGDACSLTTSVTAKGVDSCSNAEVSNTSTRVCPVATLPSIAVTANCPTTSTPVGGNLIISGTVQNTGNVTLTNVTVNNGTTRVFGPVTLAPSASANYTATTVVPTGVCSITQAFTAAGNDQCAGRPVTANVSAICQISTTAGIDITANCPAGTLTPGATAQYTGTVRNTGTVALNSVKVSNGEVDFFTVASLAPGASANFSAPVTIPADTCSVSATFTASASDNCGSRSVTKSASVTCAVATAPAIAVTHDCPTTTLVPGGTGTFVGSVRNSGNVTLNDVTVKNGTVVVFGPAALAPGAAASFTGQVIAPAADSCTVTTTLTATGTGKCNGPSVTATSSKTCPVVTAPGITLVKDCPTTAATSGGTLTYTANVRNTGNVTLNNVVVNRGTTRIFGPISLAPGASQNFTANVTVPANSCAITETWVATGQDKCSNASVSADNTTTCPVVTNAGIDLALNCPTGAQSPGSQATYTGVIRNTGGVTLTNITVINPSAPSTPVFTSALLAPGATVNFTAAVSVPNNVCAVTASFTVSGTDVCGARVVTKSASTTCPVTTAPAIALSHDCPVGGFLLGQSTSFAGSVRNTGNITLSNVVVSLPGNARVYGPAILEPGQSATFTASVTVPLTQKVCTFVTTLTAGANDACSGKAVAATSTKTCPVNFNPDVEITLACPTGVLNQGAKVSYSGTVRNIGNIALKNLHVYSALTGGTVVFDENVLFPGESFKFTVPVVVPANCCSMSQTARVTAVDNCGNTTISDTATATCPVSFTGGLVLTKDCPVGKMVFIGDTLRYTGTIKNSGNITLTDVRVTTVVGESAVTLLGPIALAPGQIVPYKAAYVVPVDYCDSGVAAHGVTLCGSQTVSAANPVRCAIMTTPMVMVSQQCPEVEVTSGSTYSFTGTVVNAGDVTLTNVVVRSARPGTAVLVGPITLLPGASAPFSGSYQIHGDCCQIVNTITVTGGDRCNGTVVNNSDSIVCPIRTNPALGVIRNCNGSSFTGTVQNTGDVNLTDVIVSIGEGTKLLGPINLAPGESETFSGVDSGNSAVVARGTSICKQSIVSSQATCGGETGSGIVIHTITMVGGSVAIDWSATEGSRYVVQFRDAGLTGGWHNLGGEVVAAGSKKPIRTTDAAVSQPSRLYRVISAQ